MTDLWPKTFGESTVKAPVFFLKQQAALLGAKTQNVVVAEVTQGGSSAPAFRYQFLLVAPALSMYKFELFAITYGLDLYPVTFMLESRLLRELYPSDKITSLRVENQDEFLGVLEVILRAERTKTAIQALIVQSRAGSVKGEDLPF